MASTESHIAIAGAGIAGLACAIAFARQGRSVVVYERAPALEEVGAGLQLAPNAIRALQSLGAWDAIEPRLTRPDRLHIADGVTGLTLKCLELGEGFHARYQAPYCTMMRADLHGALQEVAGACSGIRICPGTEIASYRNIASGVVVITRDGQELLASALIGADGIRSAVRATMLADGDPTARGTLFRGLGNGARVAPSTSVNLWMLPGGHVVSYALRNSQILNVVVALDEGTPQTHFQNVPAPLAEIIGSVSAWTQWPAADREPVPRWSQARVLLVGDAAHPTLPYMSQGACMALEDAAALMDCTPENENNLERFVAQRQALTARTILASRRQRGIYHASGAMRVARNMVLGAMPESLFWSRLDWLYRERRPA